MVPAAPAPTKSVAEVFLFERIRDQLSSDWIALHSVGLTIHKRKPWAEIDFVLIGPPGVLCLEVKGGLVTREEGVWYTTPQHGEGRGKRRRLKESPFAQVGSASAEIFTFLEASMPKVRDAIVGYAVAAPDVEWAVRGPDIDLALVYDISDAANPFSDYVDRVIKRWSEKVGTQWNKSLESFARADKQRALELLRGDFQLVPSLAAVADAADRDLVRLTDEQCELFARLASNPRVIARGGAGTGKTVIAVEEARRLSAIGKRVLFLCLSPNLAGHIESALRDVPGVAVRTMHDQMTEMVVAAGRAAELPDVSPEDLRSLFLPELALEVALEDATGQWDYDVVIIDEAQDVLREAYIDVVEALVGGDLSKGEWRLFLDPNQNVFGGVAPAGLARVRAASPVDWPLSINCRNTAPIAAQVSLLSGSALAEPLVKDGPDVEITWYEGRADQRAAVEDRLRQLRREGFPPGRIVLLSRYALGESSLDGWKPPLTDVSGGNSESSPATLRFATVSSFKGLEADVVLLVDVDDLSTNDGLASVYVGASRAKLALYVFISNGEHDQFQNLAKEFGRLLAEASSGNA